jgi:hypothetical protein
MWDRWQRGESLSSIGRRFDRASSSIFPHLAQFGGIRPPQGTRSRRVLSLIEREEISRGLVAKRSFCFIAQRLNRSPSTISREVRRNGGRQTYRAARSDQRAWDCATRPKLCKLSFNDPLCQLIARKLRRKWSPQQIAGWLSASIRTRSSTACHMHCPAGYCAALSREGNDLSQPLCSDPWGFEEGITGVSAQSSGHPSLTTCNPKGA